MKKISAAGELQSELSAALRRKLKRDDPELESLPDEACGGTYDGNDYCTKKYGHPGPCNIRIAGDVEERLL